MSNGQRTVTQVSTDAEEAAAILRGYKDRIEQLEEERTSGSSTVQVYRRVNETAICSDAISTTVNSSGGFTWNSSTWGTDEWGDTST